MIVFKDSKAILATCNAICNIAYYKTIWLQEKFAYFFIPLYSIIPHSTFYKFPELCVVMCNIIIILTITIIIFVNIINKTEGLVAISTLNTQHYSLTKGYKLILYIR